MGISVPLPRWADRITRRSGWADEPEAFEAGEVPVERDDGSAVLECESGEVQDVELEWRQGDAEDLPFDDDAFDVVMSCVGVMFAPHHQASADQLVRVCKPGGTPNVDPALSRR